MSDNPLPALAVGLALTVMSFVAVTAPQLPPLVVRVSVTVPLSEAPAVYVAVEAFVAFDQDPAPPLHVLPVAAPPTEPPIWAELAL